MSEAEFEHHAVVEQLWREYLVARQYTAGSGDELIANLFGRKARTRFGAPRWFVMVELGLGRGNGPSYFGVSRTLKRDNRRRKRLYEDRERRETEASQPKPVTKSCGRSSERDRRRRSQAV